MVPPVASMLRSTLMSNSVSCAVVQRQLKASGTIQVPGRISFDPLIRSLSAEYIEVQIHVTLCKHFEKTETVFADPSSLVWSSAESSISSSEHLFVGKCNYEGHWEAKVRKLTPTSTVDVAMRIAHAEIEHFEISCLGLYADVEPMRFLAQSALGELDTVDRMWASIVMISVLSLSPSTRTLLSKYGASCSGVALCNILELYGRTEISKRLKKQNKSNKSNKNQDDKKDAFVLKTQNVDLFSLTKFWASCFQNSCYDSIVKVLVSSSSTATTGAAQDVLAQQLGCSVADIDEEDDLFALSRDSASMSSNVVSRMLNESQHVTVGKKNEIQDERNSDSCLVVFRLSNISSTTQHLKVFHAIVMREVFGNTDAILSRMRTLGTNCIDPRSVSQARIKDFINANSSFPEWCDSNGFCRSLVVLKSSVTIHKESAQAANRFLQEGFCEKEPNIMVSNKYAVALRVSEQISSMCVGKSRRGRVCRAWCGPTIESDTRIPSKEQPYVADNEPPPIAAIVDLNFSIKPNAVIIENEQVEAAVKILICADSAVRLPEAVKALRLSLMNEAVDLTSGSESSKNEPSAKRKTLFDLGLFSPSSPTTRICLPLIVNQINSLLYVGASQASFINCLASSLGSGTMNSMINSSKRPTIADNSTLLFCSVFDCYVGGLTNLRQSFPGSCYAGAYASKIDLGISSVGLLAKNVTSDGRQHGSQLLSQAVCDKMLEQVADNFFVNDGSTAYVRPVETRGIPHGLTPGVHSALDTFVSATTHIERIIGAEDKKCKFTILCLPCSRWTQSLCPFSDTLDQTHQLDVSRTSDQRSKSIGKAYLADSTDERLAIAVGPHVPPPSQTNSGSNFLANAYDNVSVVFECAALISLIAQEHKQIRKPKSSRSALDLLRDEISLWTMATMHHHHYQNPAKVERTAASHIFCASALALINCMYPTSWSVGDPILLCGIAKAIPRLQKNQIF